MFLAESDITGVVVSCIATLTYRSKPSADRSSTSENIVNSIFIYGLELLKNIEFESIFKVDLSQGPLTLSDSYIWKVNVGCWSPGTLVNLCLKDIISTLELVSTNLSRDGLASSLTTSP